MHANAFIIYLFPQLLKPWENLSDPPSAFGGHLITNFPNVMVLLIINRRSWLNNQSAKYHHIPSSNFFLECFHKIYDNLTFSLLDRPKPFVILLCVMPDEFTCQGRISGGRGGEGYRWTYLPMFLL